MARITFKNLIRDFPGGPVVKSPPSNAGDVGSIPSQGTKILHVEGQLSPWATTGDGQMLQWRPDISSKYAYVNVHRLKKNPSATERTQAVHLEFGVYMPPLSTCHVTLDKLRTYITLPEPQGPHLPQL